MIKTENICKSFKVHKKAPGLMGSFRSLFTRDFFEKPALKDVSIDVSAGEILGLIGANGAGKTTLVKILAGIIHPTSGTVSVLGHDPWKRHNDFRRNIALIMGQKAQLWWDLPAEDCFLLLKEIYEIPQEKFSRNLEYLVDSLGVAEQLNIQVRRLSLGERMKMELIAALLHEPKVVFLDEPTIGLDLTAQKTIRSFLLDYRKQHAPAMILTSHYMEDIQSLCERIAILRLGEKVYDGSIEHILDRYATHREIHLRVESAGHSNWHVTDILKTNGIEQVACTVLHADANIVKLRVRRNLVGLVASAMLKALPVIDLNIVDEDIGNIIEALQLGESDANEDATEPTE